MDKQSAVGDRLNLTKTKLLAFAGPAAPISAMGLPLAVYIPPFYAQQVGLGVTIVGIIFMVTRLWDMVTDPVLGLVSDKFTTRWGRRRIWIVLSVPVMVLCTWMVFMPDAGVGAGYLLFWMVLMYVGWTLLTISHMSWGAELTPDYHERSLVQSAREIALLSGMIFVLTLPAIAAFLLSDESVSHWLVMQYQAGLGQGGVREWLGGIAGMLTPDNIPQVQVASMGWFVIIFLPLTVLFAVWRVPERKSLPVRSTPWRDVLTVLAKNEGLRRILITDIASGISTGVVASLFLFLARDALKLSDGVSSLLLLGYFLSGVIFIPVMLFIARRIGKHRTLAFSNLFNACTIPFILIVPEGNPWIALVCWVLFGINLGANSFLTRSIMADVADHDTVESHNQRTGLFFALLTMTYKAGYAVALGVSYIVLEWIGYTPGGENSEWTLDILRNIYVWPPVVLGVVAAVAIWRYPIDEARQVENRRILEARALDAAAGMVDDMTLPGVDSASVQNKPS